MWLGEKKYRNWDQVWPLVGTYRADRPDIGTADDLAVICTNYFEIQEMTRSL